MTAKKQPKAREIYWIAQYQMYSRNNRWCSSDAQYRTEQRAESSAAHVCITMGFRSWRVVKRSRSIGIRVPKRALQRGEAQKP